MGLHETGPIGGGSNNGGGQSEAPTPQKIALTADMVRIVDPPPGDRSDEGEAAKTVDNDPESAWETQGFKSPKFGNLKAGMGVLINLGTPRNVSDIRVETSAPGVAMEIRTGTSAFDDSSSGDKKVVETYKKLGDSDDQGTTTGTREVLTGFDADTKYQYILVWLTALPLADDGRYRVSVSNIEVYGS